MRLDARVQRRRDRLARPDGFGHQVGDRRLRGSDAHTHATRHRTPATPATARSDAAAPTLTFQSWPSPLRGSGAVALAVSAPAGLKSVAVFLGARQVCTLTAAPFSLHDQRHRR